MKDYKLYDRLIDKFFRYLEIESQSDSENNNTPSSIGQMELSKILKNELEELNLIDINLNQKGVLTGVLPSNDYDNKYDKIGRVCHLDTVDVGLSPKINPKIIKNYNGKDIIQNSEKNILIKVKDHPELLNYINDDLIISDGLSVLGADNKAAIANIMTVLEILNEDKSIRHGDIYIAFVPDEEIGLKGSHFIDFDKFKPDYAYTIDSCEIGEIIYETFNAGSATLNIKGVPAHPMNSKNNLVNPIMVANDFINLLDKAKTPEHTEGREGYIWVTDINTYGNELILKLNIRDHDKNKYENKKIYLKKALEIIKMKYPKAEINMEIKDIYSNIKDFISDDNKKSIDNLYEAFKALDIKPKTIAMRGGTDGSFISTMGIITPNYFTGAHNFHSNAEFMPMSSFIKSTEVSLKLIELSLKK